MPQRTDELDLGSLRLSSGEARSFDLHAALGDYDLTGARYVADPKVVPVRLDISRTLGSGYALRLRFAASLTGACMRCLEPAVPTFEVDAREVDQPGVGDEELASPYVEDSVLDVARWAHDAFALAMPAQIVCRADCRGLCPECGVNLNDDPDHVHERGPDPRWAKLGELKLE